MVHPHQPRPELRWNSPGRSPSVHRWPQSAQAPALFGSRSAWLRAACGSKKKTFFALFGPAEAGALTLVW
jgi:hypothetical protein